MPQDYSRLKAPIVVLILLTVILIVVYNAGLSRGRLAIDSELMTAVAQPVTAETAAREPEPSPVQEATPAAPVAVLLPTNTPTVTPTPTASHTPTPSRTPTPSVTPTATATPASPQEWAERYQAVAVDALNSLPISDFSPERGEALLRSIAQEQGLIFVPAAHHTLQGPFWATLVVPRTPRDQALPMLFWREPNDFNRIRSQLLLDELAATSTGYDYSRFYGGISRGAVRADYIGRFHILLIERVEAYPRLSAHVLVQSQPAGRFERLWWSGQELFWTQRAAGSRVELVDSEASVLPDMVIYAPLDRGRDLRDQVGAAAAIVEQSPFARQWAETRWRYITVEGALDLGGVVEPGYNLQAATLVPTPLTSLARFLQLLQVGNVSGASEYSTRFDLMQTAFDLGLREPGEWLALYVDERDLPLYGPDVTPRMLLFANRDRNRSFVFQFEPLAEGSTPRIVALSQVEPYLALDLVTPVPPSAGGADLGLAIAQAPALEPTETPTPTPEPTQPGTPTPTLTPLPTATATGPPTETPLPTATPPPTSTPTPGPIPAIPDDEAPVAQAIVFRAPANLRGGPDTSYDPVAQLGYGVVLDLFGITEVGDWVVVRINDPTHGQSGALGWVAQDLLQVTQGDLSQLARYSAAGLPLIPPTPGPTPAPLPTDPPTPRPTPVLTQPGVSPLADLILPPGPGADERVYTLIGETLPANPFLPIPAVEAEGGAVRLAVDGARVQVWSGAFGVNPPDWVGAQGELLWPNSEVYVVGEPDPLDANRIVVQRIRIARGPSLERVRLNRVDDFAAALARREAVALMGSREEPGVYLLETQTGLGGAGIAGGVLRQLWVEEQEAQWAGGAPAEGVLIGAGAQSLGINRVTWIRSDGESIRITAQPFHAVQGVAGDLFGGLWWIEVPQVDLYQWQLWHFDPVQGQILLRYRAGGEAFAAPGAPGSRALTPSLLAVRPRFDSGSGAVTGLTLFVDTMDASQQRLYTGVYRLRLGIGGNGLGAPEGPAEPLLAPDSYRGPLQLNAGHTRLAYFVYDPDHPSLTSGFIRPPNQVHVLDIFDDGVGRARTVYATENRFEFLAPNLAWHGPDELIVARSRFAAGEVFGLDRFGITRIRLPAEPAGEPEAWSYLFPNRRVLRDYAPCLEDGHVLTIVATETGELELGRWDGLERPVPLFLLPSNQTRAFLCWQAGDALLNR